MPDAINDINWLSALAAFHLFFGFLLIISIPGNDAHVSLGAWLAMSSIVCFGYFRISMHFEERKLRRHPLSDIRHAVEFSAWESLMDEEVVPEDREFKKKQEDNDMQHLQGKTLRSLSIDEDTEKTLGDRECEDKAGTPILQGKSPSLSKFSDSEWIFMVTMTGFYRGLSIFFGSYVDLKQIGIEFCCWGGFFGFAAFVAYYLLEYSSETEDKHFNAEKEKAKLISELSEGKSNSDTTPTPVSMKGFSNPAESNVSASSHTALMEVEGEFNKQKGVLRELWEQLTPENWIKLEWKSEIARQATTGAEKQVTSLEGEDRGSLL